jgi:hypothetical protein
MWPLRAAGHVIGQCEVSCLRDANDPQTFEIEVDPIV